MCIRDRRRPDGRQQIPELFIGWQLWMVCLCLLYTSFPPPALSLPPAVCPQRSRSTAVHGITGTKHGLVKSIYNGCFAATAQQLQSTFSYLLMRICNPCRYCIILFSAAKSGFELPCAFRYNECMKKQASSFDKTELLGGVLFPLFTLFLILRDDPLKTNLSWIGNGLGYRPVSYTHLDVYKRQLQ